MISPKIRKLLELNPIARKNLADSLIDKGISVKVSSIITKIPREYFISEDIYNEAYEDKALPISLKQTISQPYTVGFMTDLLNLQNGNKVLEVGTGSGYQSIILKMLGAELFTIEIIDQLYLASIETFKNFDLNVSSFLADGSVGLPQFAPFDRIIVTAAAPVIPDQLADQLAIGGVMVIPVGSKSAQVMIRLERLSHEKYYQTEHSTFRFVPLVGIEGWKF